MAVDDTEGTSATVGGEDGDPPPSTSADRVAADRDGGGFGEPQGALGLVARLASSLDAAGVAYCHWKSNEAVGRAVAGDTDLDLLVARRDAARFKGVLYGLSFCVGRPPPARRVPGVLDYYGVDEASGRVVHVHAHYLLALGDDMTKNVRLPIEGAYLRSTVRGDPLPLPAPEFEYVVFVLRMVLKHATWDAQADGRASLTSSERRELAYLEERIDREEVHRLVEDSLPFLTPAFFEACAAAAHGSVGRAHRAVTAGRLVRLLRAHSRRPPGLDVVLRMWRRRWRGVQHRIPGRTKKKRPDIGGLLVAVVGGDGSGKSSAVEFLDDLLSPHFDVKVSHLGKPPRSRLSRAVRLPMQRLRTVKRSLREPPTDGPRQAQRQDVREKFPGLAFVLWQVLKARDRHLEYRRMRRAVTRGSIAVCDRFPLPRVRLMDAPRTTALPDLQRRPVARWLAGREAHYYARIMPPDLLIVLRVPPDLAVERRSDEDHDRVRQRAAEIFALEWTDTDAVVVDTAAPLDRVRAELTKTVWSAL